MRHVPILAGVLVLAACHNQTPTAPAPGGSSAAAVAPAASPSPVPAPPPPAPAQAKAPDEVEQLVQRIERCEHFAGEEPYDQARARELRAQVAANCRGNRAALEQLRQRHAGDPQVLNRLAGLDPPAM